jgi:hypothetical protein
MKDKDFRAPSVANDDSVEQRATVKQASKTKPARKLPASAASSHVRKRCTVKILEGKCDTRTKGGRGENFRSIRRPLLPLDGMAARRSQSWLRSGRQRKLCVIAGYSGGWKA